MTRYRNILLCNLDSQGQIPPPIIRQLIIFSHRSSGELFVMMADLLAAASWKVRCTCVNVCRSQQGVPSLSKLISAPSAHESPVTSQSAIDLSPSTVPALYAFFVFISRYL